MPWFDEAQPESELANQQSQAALPTKINTPKPGFLAGSAVAIPKGIGAGVGKVVDAIGDSPLSYPLDAAGYGVNSLYRLATGEETESFEENRERVQQNRERNLNQTYDYLAPQADDGLAANVLYGLGDYLTRAGIGGVFGGVAGAAALTGGSDYNFVTDDLVRKGVDKNSARVAGAIQGTTSAILTATPLSFVRGGASGLAQAGDAVIAVGAPVLLDSAGRAINQNMLENKGYEQQAKQFEVTPETVLTGLVLGGVMHGAARYAKNKQANQAPEQTATTPEGLAQQAEAGSVPDDGIVSVAADDVAAQATHTEQVHNTLSINQILFNEDASAPIHAPTPFQVNQHLQNMRTATEQLASGRPVSVPHDLQGLPKNSLPGQAGRIATAAQQAGINPQTALVISHIETGGTFSPKAQNPTSSANGLFQVIDSSWKKFAGGNRADIGEQIRVGLAHMKEVSGALRTTLKREPVLHEEYMGHLLGPGGASKVLTANPNAKLYDVVLSYAPGKTTAAKAKYAQSVVNNNGMKGLTVGQAIAKWKTKTEQVQANLGGSQSFAGNQALISAFGENQAKTVDDLANFFYESQAEQLGVTPAEVRSRYPLAIDQNIDDALGAYNQVELRKLYGYRDSHMAPDADSGANARNIADIFPDVASPSFARDYGHGVAYDGKAARIIQDLHKNPDGQVTIYRAVPKNADGTINYGDWVSLTREYAKEHGNARLNGEFKIVEQKINKDDLYNDGNSIHEWGYAPKDSETYRARSQLKSDLSAFNAEHDTHLTLADVLGSKGNLKNNAQVAREFLKSTGRELPEVLKQSRYSEAVQRQFGEVLKHDNAESALNDASLVDQLFDSHTLQGIRASLNSPLKSIRARAQQKLDRFSQMSNEQKRNLVSPLIHEAFNGGTSGIDTVATAHATVDAAKLYKSDYDAYIDTILQDLKLDHYNQQVYGEVLGRYYPGENLARIGLGEKADLATVVHELGHHFLETSMRIAALSDAPLTIKSDMDIVMQWAGLGDKAAGFEELSAADKTRLHEQFAETFERYMATGKSSNPKMQQVFEQFRSFIAKAYQGIKEYFSRSPNARLSDDIAGVMDRMIGNKPKGAETFADIPEVQANLGGSNTVRAYGMDGSEHHFAYSVRSADELVTSNNTDFSINELYPAELQPRDRTREASRQQIENMADDLRPELLADSYKLSDGAPIIGNDLVVESGNGRTLALKRAYEQGKAENYKKYLLNNAERFGLNRGEIEGITNPVLVRTRLSDVADRAAFTRLANESDVAQMSSTERAKTDVNRLPDSTGLKINADGTINLDGSINYVRQFVASLPKSEQGMVMSKDGRLSQEGKRRIESALMQQAYNDPRIIERLTENLDDNSKNVLSALLKNAPRLAQLNDLVKQGGRHSNTVADDAVQAAHKFSDLRANGLTVEDYLGQGQLIDDGLSDGAKALLADFGNGRSAKQMSEAIERRINEVESLGDPRQGDMFADLPEVQAARQVLNELPDLQVAISRENANGEIETITMSAKERMAELEAEMKQAGEMDTAAKAAAMCALQFGE